jgi:hypothetical protein
VRPNGIICIDEYEAPTPGALYADVSSERSRSAFERVDLREIKSALVSTDNIL